jgi:hypothetical protein
MVRKIIMIKHEKKTALELQEEIVNTENKNIYKSTIGKIKALLSLKK